MNFGSNAMRFKSQPKDDEPGPGQYKISNSSNNLLNSMGTSNFKAPPRKEIFVDLIQDNPAPGDYLSEK